MKSTESALNPSATNAFVPMSESKMSSLKGGNDWIEWFEEIYEYVSEDVQTVITNVTTAAGGKGLNFSDEFWSDLEGQLQDEGVDIPDEGLCDFVIW